MNRTKFEQLLATYHEHIRRFGWTAIGVGSGDGMPNFTYTAGFRETIRHPDIIVMRLSPDIAHQTFQQIYHLITNEGMRFEPGHEYTEIAYIPVRFLTVTAAWKERTMVQTYNVYGDWDFEALQLIFPDKAGRWPGEEGWVKEQSGWPFLDRDGVSAA